MSNFIPCSTREGKKIYRDSTKRLTAQFSPVDTETLEANAERRFFSIVKRYDLALGALVAPGKAGKQREEVGRRCLSLS